MTSDDGPQAHARSEARVVLSRLAEASGLAPAAAEGVISQCCARAGVLRESLTARDLPAVVSHLVPILPHFVHDAPQCRARVDAVEALARSAPRREPQLVAILRAYHAAILVAAPALHPTMESRSAAWLRATAEELTSELAGYLRDASRPDCAVRVFFKLGQDLRYGGCNAPFAADAGVGAADAMVGLDDFDPRIAWVAQAAKYRSDDRSVIERGAPKLGIIERQSSSSGLIWLDTSKVPIVDGDTAVGVFGTYEIIDGRTAAQRALARQRLTPATRHAR